MRILLGVSGGVAAYKAAELVRRFQQRGHTVRVILTRGAQAFITPLTMAALTGEKPFTDLLSNDPSGIEHIAVAQETDAVVVAPATAHTLARFAQGLADDFLTTAYLAATAPVVLAPSMNARMWEHPATQANMALLRARGAVIAAPGEGYLACGMTGAGRMAELEAIVAAAETAGASASLPAKRDLEGETVLVTAGPTREAIDPVRYLTNRSSGKMGYALAAEARRRGARVCLVSGPTGLADPEGVETTRVVTAAEMADATAALFPQATIAILAAAVADYRPARPSGSKMKKTGAGLTLELEPTADILAGLGRAKRGQVLIGFAAETDTARAGSFAREKLTAKGADLMVLNLVGGEGTGFDAEDNAVTLVGHEGERELPRAPKTAIAGQILDAAVALQAAIKTAAPR